MNILVTFFYDTRYQFRYQLCDQLSVILMWDLPDLKNQPFRSFFVVKSTGVFPRVAPLRNKYFTHSSRAMLILLRFTCKKRILNLKSSSLLFK